MNIIIPPLPEGGGGILFIPLLPEGGGGYTVLPLSVQDIFRHIFLSNC
jgi:hypothetical protein